MTLSSSAAGQGDGSIPFTVIANADASSRSAGINVNDQRVQISQDGKPCEFTVSSNREAVDGTGGNRTIEVRASAAQCGWTAASQVSWITIVSGREGVGNGAVTFHVDAVTGPSRAGAITIAGQTVQVEQGTGCTYAIGADSFSVDPTGGDRQLTVTAPLGCAWTSESKSAWITVTAGNAGSGPGVVSFRVAPTDGPARTGLLTVAGRTVTVTQSVGCNLSINPSSLSMGAQGGTGSIQVDGAPGCTWSATSSNAWITISGGAGGDGRGQVQIAVAANAGPARTGSIVVAGRTVTVAQASGCTYSVSPTTQDVSGFGGSSTAGVATASGCSWTATSGADWITLASSSGTGPGQVSFSVAPNVTPPRTGTLTVAGQIVTVNQASQCTWQFAPPYQEFDAGGGSGAILVLVSGACSWNAVSTTDWIGITSGSSGVSNGLVQFTVAPNTGSARVGIISIANQSYQVRQGGR